MDSVDKLEKLSGVKVTLLLFCFVCHIFLLQLLVSFCLSDEAGL